MKGDLPEAACRLLSCCTVRTHERNYIRHVQGSKAPPHVIVRGVEYPSVIAAARAIKKDRSVVRRMLKLGTARYK